MKKKVYLLVILLVVTTLLNNCARKDNLSVLKGPYLGQKPPGMIPKIVVPNIKATDKNESCSSIEIKVEKIGANLFKMSHKVNNWIALIGPEGALLSDAGPEFLAHSIKKKLLELGNGEVKYIINTHWHHDHTGANLLFGKEAIVVAHHSVRCCLAEKQEISLFEETFEAYPEDALPDITFSTRLKIHFNGEEIGVISLPRGHSQGDAVVYFKQSNVLHVGDLYIADHFPPIDYDHGGDVQQFAQNLETIMKMFPNNVKIVSGHLKDATMKDLSNYHYMITTTTNIVRKELKNGRSLEDMQKANILKGWEAWGKHVSCSLWIKTIFHSLTKKNKQQKTPAFPKIKGPYMGQKPPDDIPKLYSTRILSKIEFMDIPVFFKNGEGLIFKGKYDDKNGVFVMEQKNKIWSEPRKILTLGPFEDRHFFLTANEKKLYFTSRRSIQLDDGAIDDSNIWALENTASGWTEPYPLEFPVNTKKFEYFSTATREGTLYFTRSSGKGDADIYRSRNVNGKFSTIEKLGTAINSKYVEADPFVALDESYIIFLSDRPGGHGQHDFYISFKNKNNFWTKSIHLGKRINSKGNDVCPLVTPDGRFFFFASNRTGRYEVYWVNLKIIDDLKPKFFQIGK